MRRRTNFNVFGHAPMCLGGAVHTTSALEGLNHQHFIVYQKKKRGWGRREDAEKDRISDRLVSG